MRKKKKRRDEKKKEKKRREKKRREKERKERKGKEKRRREKEESGKQTNKIKEEREVKETYLGGKTMNQTALGHRLFIGRHHRIELVALMFGLQRGHNAIVGEAVHNLTATEREARG